MIKGNILVAIFSFYIVTTMQSQGLTRPRTWENSGIAIEFQCLLYFGCDLNEYICIPYQKFIQLRESNSHSKLMQSILWGFLFLSIDMDNVLPPILYISFEKDKKYIIMKQEMYSYLVFFQACPFHILKVKATLFYS